MRIYICIYIYIYNCLGDEPSFPGQVIPKTQNMVLDAALTDNQHYKGKLEKSRERSSALPYSCIVAIVKGAFRSPSTTVFNVTYIWSTTNPPCETVTTINRCNIYIYIYIYIYILSSTDRSVSFYQNSSVWLDGLDSRSWDRNPVDSNANPRFYHSAMRNPTLAK